MPWKCNCLNGGICLEGGIACECPLGFVGKRCEELYFNLDDVTAERGEKGVGNNFIVFIVILFIAAAGLTVFFLWRRLRSMRRKKMKRLSEKLKTACRINDITQLEQSLHKDYKNNVSSLSAIKIILSLEGENG